MTDKTTSATMLIKKKISQTSSTNFQLKISSMESGGEKTCHGSKKKPISRSAQKFNNATGADLYSMAKPRNPAEENTINGKTKTIILTEKYPSGAFLSTALPD